jgi:hypothetical protein
MKNEIRRLLVGSVLAGCALAGGCDENHSGGSPGARVDDHAEEIMSSTAKAEARQWMTDPKHVLFKADPKEVGQFVEDFYKAGAVQVLIGDIEEHDGTLYGESLLVVLPQGKDLRAKIFEVVGRADMAFENDPVSDKGQKYLYWSLD